MAFTPTELDTWLDTLNTDGAYLSLHTADPGTSGTSEVTGGSPAYARKALTWSAAAAGSKSAAMVTFNVPASTVTHWGLWSAASGGTFAGGFALSPSQVFGSQGTLDVTPTITAT